MIMKLGLSVMLVLAFSGCIGSGDDEGGNAALTFDGDGAGQHSQTAECDDQGTIAGSGNILDGEVTITLRDASETRLFQQTFEGEFELTEKTISGTAGDWDLHAQRRGNDVVGDAYAGSYEFFVNC